MRRFVIAIALAGCGGPQVAEPTSGSARDVNLTTGATLAADEDDHPAYSRAELEQALIAERGAEATGERKVGDLSAALDAGSGDAGAANDALRVASADLTVRRQFIAALEDCQQNRHRCPPRLDEPRWTWDPNAPTADPSKPPLDAPLRFDLDDWRKVADELHGRACACRTIGCVDSIGTTIDLLEPRPMQDVRGDDAASAAITAARECLFRLRGKR